MDRYRFPAMTAPQSVVKSEGKKLRRKLQKIGNQQRNYQLPTTGAKPPETGGYNKSTLGSKKPSSDKSIARTVPSLPLQWFGYVRNSGCPSDRVSRDVSHLSPEPKGPLSHSVVVVPELAHLSIHNAEPRSSSETAASHEHSANVSISSGTRRYAKTPVLRIGQLEGRLVRTPITAQTTSNLEAIAESYRALLDSRCSFMPDRRFDSSESLYLDSVSEQTRLRTPGGMPKETKSDKRLPSQSSMGSPASDDGTLVGFEEDTIYFKPISFEDHSAPSSPCRLETDNPRNVTSAASTRQEDPSLHLCFDLLTRELSSAASGSPQRPSAETSALQIWVMIEAYEKLRDQVRQTGQDDDKSKSTQDMFDVWLRALYAIHDDMTGKDGQQSESVYGDAEC